MEKVVVTGSEHWLGSENFVYTRVLPDAAIDVNEAEESIKARYELHPKVCTGFLLDLREIKSASKEARMLFKEDLGHGGRYFGMAIVVGNTLSRLIGSSYLGFNRPEGLQIQLFESVEEAHQWLCEVKRHHKGNCGGSIENNHPQSGAMRI